MGRVRYTPSRILKEVVLARKPLGKTGIGWAESDGQSQIHTQPCLEESRVGEETIGGTGIGWAESDTHPTES